MKRRLRKLLRLFLKLPIKGRYIIADKLGSILDEGKPEIMPINGIDLEIDHSIAMYRYLYYGLYEISLVNFLKRNIKEGDIVFDPGTNVGYIAAIQSGLVGETGMVYCFEPSISCFSKIKNYLSNKKNISLLFAAIFDKIGKAEFVDTPRVISNGWAALKEAYAPIEGNAYLIDTWSIDSFCSTNKIEYLKFLKLDIEEAEFLAIRGAKRMLENKAIEYVLIETSFSEENTQKTSSMHQQLLAAGYRPFLPNKKGILNDFDFNNSQYLRYDLIWTWNY